MPKQNGNITFILFTESSTAKFYVVFMVAATHSNKNFTMWDKRSNDIETISCVGFKRPSGAIEVRATEKMLQPPKSDRERGEERSGLRLNLHLVTSTHLPNTS